MKKRGTGEEEEERADKRHENNEEVKGKQRRRRKEGKILRAGKIDKPNTPKNNKLMNNK